MDPSQPQRRARSSTSFPPHEQFGDGLMFGPIPLPAAEPMTPADDPLADGDWMPDAGVSDFTQVALWMTGTLAGLFTACFLAQAPLFRALARRLGLCAGDASTAGRHRAPKPPTREQALPMLAEAVIGNSKAAVARVFGPPPSAALHASVIVPTPATFWRADTWYYPLAQQAPGDAGFPIAIAIEFADDSARRVFFLRSPAAAAA